jgi:hypothetical protein
VKYRTAITIANIVDFIDDKIFGHADRWFPLRTRIRYPLCNWSGNLHEWAAKQCCDDGCLRCWNEEDIFERDKERQQALGMFAEGQGSFELLEEFYIVRQVD